MNVRRLFSRGATPRPPFKGTRAVVGGTEYIIPSLSVGVKREIIPQLSAAVNRFQTTGVLTHSDVDLLIDVAKQALLRNYPALSADEIEVMLSNVRDINSVLVAMLKSNARASRWRRA